MRLVFFGTPEFAVPTLDAVAREHEVALVIAQPDKPAGRGMKLQAPAVAVRARELGLPLAQPPRIRNTEFLEEIERVAPDCGIVVAYGKILPAALLAIPKHGFLNVHASVLPRWRGAAPIQRAILAGDRQTGITIMQMEQGLDTGPMLAAQGVAIDRKTAGELTDELAALGANLMAEVLKRFSDAGRMRQNEARASYAPKIRKEEARLDFTLPAAQVERQVRAFNPVPGAYFEYEGERIKILAAELSELNGTPGTVLDHGLTIACGEGAIVPTMVQRAGRAPMLPAELLRGFVIPAGACLT
ncbi:MAG: methionyl-tRNA formyltransferase [Acidobacteria bacterium]|nr:methionyl-tRNA formyltransferase [Acidobacteriota bacterium]